MKSVGLFEAKTKFSEICDDVVRTCEPVTITRRGRPVVRIVPVEHILDRWMAYKERHPEDYEGEEDFELPPRSREKSRFRL